MHNRKAAADLLGSLPPQQPRRGLWRSGYSPVANDVAELGFPLQASGSLRIGEGVLVNARGCWHCRVRNSTHAPDAPRWLWIEQVDHLAPQRYRRRAWVLSTGAPPPPNSKLKVACGDDRCVNPDHLDLILLEQPKTPLRPSGHWRWAMEIDEETGEEVEVGEWVSEAAEPCGAIDWSRVLVRDHDRPKAVSQRAQWEATRDWQAIGAEVQALDQETLWSIRTEHHSFAASAARRGLSVDAIRAIRYGRYGEGRRPDPTRSARSQRGTAKGEAASGARLNETDVRAIRASSESHAALARQYGVSDMAIYKIRSGKTWAHVT